MSMERLTPSPLLDRRHFLTRAAGVAGAAFLAPTLIGAPQAHAAGIPPARRMPFSVRRGDDFIGNHVVTFSQSGNRVEVLVTAAFEVKVAFVTAWRYEHQNREVWEDGRLISVDSTTNDDGTDLSVTARATATGLDVQGREGRFTAPADTLSTSWWNAGVVGRNQVLDTQNGIMRSYSVSPGSWESVTAGGRPVQARPYVLSGDFNLTIWFSDQDQWVKMRFDARGEQVDYRLQAEGAVLVGAS